MTLFVLKLLPFSNESNNRIGESNEVPKAYNVILGKQTHS